MNRRLTLTTAVLLLLGSAFWWFGAREARVTERAASSREASPGDGDSRIDSELEAPVSRTSAEKEMPSSLPLWDDLQSLAASWEQRYPRAEVVGRRIVDTGAGIRAQRLLATGSSRIPWVVWEDKVLWSSEEGFVSVGVVAHMGNLFLVEAKPELVPAADLELFLAEHGLYVERRSPVSDYVCLGFEEPRLGKLEASIAAFRERFPEAVAEFDTINFPSVAPNDWDASRMWGLDTIRALDAWQFEKGDFENQVVVAVIDTGVQLDHPDLAANIFVDPNGSGAVWDYVDLDSNPDDLDGHGTHVAGIVGAIGDNGSEAVGVNWGVQILPLKVGEADGLRTSAINDALAYVTSLKDAGINIVATNNSYGSGGSNVSTRNEIAKHNDRGIVFVAASGNDGKNVDATPEAREYPAGYTLDNIISVGNSNQEDTLNLSSNYGATSVDISAPGTEIYSTYPTNRFMPLSGTSMASPMVAGAVGLLAQAEPDLTGPQLKARILETGDRVASQNGRTVSGRRLNLLAALKPELKEHFLDVVNIDDEFVLMDDVDAYVTFETATLQDASVEASVASGFEVGDVIDVGGGVFRFVPKASGQANVRLSATLGGFTQTVEKTVFVGEAASVDQGLLHHYSFDGSGGSVLDVAGRSNGTVTGATRRSSEYGSSLGFDSSSEQMTFSGQFSDRVTIAALVRSDDMTVSPHPRIVNMPFYYLYFSSGDGLSTPYGNRQTLKFFSNYTSFGVWNTPPRSVRDGEWYYLVGTYDSTDISNTPNLFINGAEQIVRLQQPPTGSMVKTGGLSYLGNSDAGDRAFDGLMADIRVYDRILDENEIDQLGAHLLQDRWEAVRMLVPETSVIEEEAFFEILDSSQATTTLSVDWYFTEASEATVLDEVATGTTVRFGAAGNFVVTAQVSDGIATRVFTRPIRVAPEGVKVGHYEGASASGGLVWLEVEESLTSGFATVYDAESGFYRIREPVTISEDGSFESGEPGEGRLSGIALKRFSLGIDGLDLQFAGESQPQTSEISAFEGYYLGGGLGTPGDSIRMRIADDGRVFVWREGPFADLAIGSHDIDGRVQTEGASGASLDLTIDAATGFATGAWGSLAVFLSAEGSDREARLMSGVMGGFASGSGASGVYAEFVKPGELAAAPLRAGQFSATGSAATVDRGAFLLLGEGGGVRQVEVTADTDLPPLIAGMAAAGAIDLEGREVRGMRVQAPISAGKLGVAAFSITGSAPLEVLVRGLGPSFSPRGGEDPGIMIYRMQDGEALPLEPNDNWRDGALFVDENQSSQGAFRELANGFEALQLSSLADEARDAAQRVWLEPGSYLVVLSLVDGAPGSGLLEVFSL